MSPYAGICYNMQEGDLISAVGESPHSTYLSVGYLHAYVKPYLTSQIAIERINMCYELELGNFIRNEQDEGIWIVVDEMYNAFQRDLCICEMEIPEGARYWEDVTEKEICAKHMRFIKEVPIENKLTLLEYIRDNEANTEFIASEEWRQMKVMALEKLIEQYKRETE